MARRPRQPEILRTPGYPLFLLLCGLGQHYRYGFIQIAQVGMGVAIVFFTYLLGARLLNPVAGLWAAGLQSVSIGSILSSVWILSECLYSFLFMLALLLLARSFHKGSRWPIPLAAALTAAATYVRPVGIVFVPLVLAVLPRRARRNRENTDPPGKAGIGRLSFPANRELESQAGFGPGDEACGRNCQPDRLRSPAGLVARAIDRVVERDAAGRGGAAPESRDHHGFTKVRWRCFKAGA
ncbi:MAG: hypothetical protein ACR2I2_00015 [Bryobacteraceae bacterium]